MKSCNARCVSRVAVSAEKAGFTEWRAATIHQRHDRRLHNFHLFITMPKKTMADEASFSYTPGEVLALDAARQQSATTVTDVVDQLVAVAGTGSLAVVIFAPPGCGKMTAAMKVVERFQAKCPPRSVATVWGAKCPPADAPMGATFECVGAAMRRGSKGHEWVAAAMGIVDRLINENKIVVYIMGGQGTSSAVARLDLLDRVSSCAKVVGVLYAYRTGRVTAALAGAVGNLKQGAFPGIEDTLSAFDQFQGITAAEVRTWHAIDRVVAFRKFEFGAGASFSLADALNGAVQRASASVSPRVVSVDTLSVGVRYDVTFRVDRGRYVNCQKDIYTVTVDARCVDEVVEVSQFTLPSSAPAVARLNSS